MKVQPCVNWNPLSISLPWKGPPKTKPAGLRTVANGHDLSKGSTPARSMRGLELFLLHMASLHAGRPQSCQTHNAFKHVCSSPQSAQSGSKAETTRARSPPAHRHLVHSSAHRPAKERFKRNAPMPHLLRPIAASPSPAKKTHITTASLLSMTTFSQIFQDITELSPPCAAIFFLETVKVT